MKVVLFLNGPEGCQTGIEDGFAYLIEKKIINEVKYFYFDHAAKIFSEDKTLIMMESLVESFHPDLIVFFHINKFPVTNHFINKLKNIPSHPMIVYDEGDMYGSWTKPMTRSMKIIMEQADVVSIRGLGNFSKAIKKINHNVIYTPHHADIARFYCEPYIMSERKYPIVLIGNRIKSRIKIKKRLPGAVGREKFVSAMAEKYGSKFYLFGNGWDGFIGNQGPVEFQRQIEIYKNTWITVAYEHYPEIPYYFSNRLPIALLSGSLYVCHYHEGYENIFKGCDFIFFFRTNAEAIDIIDYIQSLSKEDLLERAVRARNFGLKYFTPQVVWSNFFNNIQQMQTKY